MASHAHFPLLSDLADFDFVFAPYRLRAITSQLLRLAFTFLRHSFKAAVSCCARVNAFGFTAATGAGTGATFPEPENVALAGAPSATGGEAVLHDSALVHAVG
jgi:hypothetical protein